MYILELYITRSYLDDLLIAKAAYFQDGNELPRRVLH